MNVWQRQRFLWQQLLHKHELLFRVYALLWDTFFSTVATKIRMLALNQAIPILMRLTASWRLLGSPSSSVAARLSALNELSNRARNRFNTSGKTRQHLEPSNSQNIWDRVILYDVDYDIVIFVCSYHQISNDHNHHEDN